MKAAGLHVQIVKKAQLAVVLGAAAWGCNPSIVARKLEHDYGASIVENYDTGSKSNELRSVLLHHPEASVVSLSVSVCNSNARNRSLGHIASNA